MLTRIIVCAIIEEKGRLLLGMKPKDVGPYPNTWHLIGGGVEDGESLEEAIKREVKEEAGISIVNITQLAFDEDIALNKHKQKTHYYFHYFLANPKPGYVLKPGDDIAILKWFNKRQLRSIPLVKGSRKRFKQMGFL